MRRTFDNQFLQMNFAFLVLRFIRTDKKKFILSYYKDFNAFDWLETNFNEFILCFSIFFFFLFLYLKSELLNILHYWNKSNNKTSRSLASVLFYPLTEALTYSCFCELMKRMAYNFPHGGAMDNHFANMRSLIQVRQTCMIHGNFFSYNICHLFLLHLLP